MTPTTNAALAAARERYNQARAQVDAAARAGDWDAVRELVKVSAAAANEASSLHDRDLHTEAA